MSVIVHNKKRRKLRLLDGVKKHEEMKKEELEKQREKISKQEVYALYYRGIGMKESDMNVRQRKI